MDYETLTKANATIKTVPIKGKQYAEVNERIRVFRMLFPNGRISTEMVSNENAMCIFKATVTDGEGHILGTGHAYEREGKGMINATSYIENCETSAVGRALAMVGIGIGTAIASFEEVDNAIQQQRVASKPAPNKPEPQPAPQPTPEPQPVPQKKSYPNRQKLVAYCAEKGIDVNKVAVEYKLNNSSTEERIEEVLQELIISGVMEG